MRVQKQLLLLAAFVFLARCQQKPKVSMSPTFKQIFSGDLFYLSCDNSLSMSRVKWYFNNEDVEILTNQTWKTAGFIATHSGSYYCLSNEQNSDSFSIDVLEYAPSASLTIKMGLPVMLIGQSVVLQLVNEDGLQGWRCWVYRGTQKIMRIKLSLEEGSLSLDFKPNMLNVPETIFWCTDSKQEHRSNQITIRTSDKDARLEMNPLPAVVGESLTLRCHVEGTDRISRTVFYKDSLVLLESVSPTYEIPSVTESNKGKYKCDATFTYVARTGGAPYQVLSDNQYVFVQEPPIKAVLSANKGLSCSCLNDSGDASYRWYHKKDGGQSWARKGSGKDTTPTESGTYACRAVWKNRRSFLSNSYIWQPPVPNTSILIAVVMVLIVLGLAIATASFYIWYKKRNTTDPIYEDVPLGVRDRSDGGYEALHRPGSAQREDEYDTLHPEAQGKDKRKGEYEALRKEEMQGGLYHTLGMEGAVGGGEGGYEALKKEGMKAGVYHTLGMMGTGEGAGSDNDKEHEEAEKKISG